MVREMASQPLQFNGHPAIESVFISDLNRLLVSPAAIKKIGDPYRRFEKRRAVMCAKKYILENLAEHIHVTNLCSYCGVSISTLERMFTREFGISPYSYIQAARLNEVRRKLLNGYPKEVTIAEIAMSCGFTHMGRFSRQYRTHFGRLPSEDRHLATNSS